MNADVEVVQYLEHPPDRPTLERAVAILVDPVADLVRKDARFAELSLDAAEYTEPEAVVDLLLEHPRLMQRPLLVAEGTAIIGRPTARVGPFLSGT
jgi:arsenate reductase (glutaredoxin)